MFIPRHPVTEDQFCELAETNTTTGIGGAVAYAGAAVFIGGVSGAETESLVRVIAASVPGSAVPVYGLLMQKVKSGYHQVHPAGYILPTDFGSSDAIAQPKYNSSGDITGTQKTPVAVAHGGGVWDTTHYTSQSGASSYARVDAGQFLYVTYNLAGRLTNYNVQGTELYQDHQYAMGPMYDVSDGTGTANMNAVAIVVKGVSAAKSESNVGGQTLYPIRIKLLV